MGQEGASTQAKVGRSRRRVEYDFIKKEKKKEEKKGKKKQPKSGQFRTKSLKFLEIP